MRFIISLILLLIIFISCDRNNEALVGRWMVDKVNVEFHEDVATPEMVRQFGEMEKSNVLEISKDSVLTLIMDADTVSGVFSLRDGIITWKGELFGRYGEGLITTETLTPMGWVRTSYKKCGSVTP